MRIEDIRRPRAGKAGAHDRRAHATRGYQSSSELHENSCKAYSRGKSVAVKISRIFSPLRAVRPVRQPAAAAVAPRCPEKCPGRRRRPHFSPIFFLSNFVFFVFLASASLFAVFSSLPAGLLFFPAMLATSRVVEQVGGWDGGLVSGRKAKRERDR